MTSHLSLSDLEALAGARTPAPERDAALAHLSHCEDCLEAFERAWQAEPTAGLPVLEFDLSAAARIERALFSRIHLASAATATSWLATDGFLQVVLGLLRPLLEPCRLEDSRQEGEPR